MNNKNRNNILSVHTVKKDAEKLNKKMVRAAKRKLRNKQISDGHTFTVFLGNIDNEFAALITEVENTRHIVDYDLLRNDKMSDTRKKLTFFNNDLKELNDLRITLIDKAKRAGVDDGLKNLELEIDVTKLKNDFDKLDRRTK